MPERMSTIDSATNMLKASIIFAVAVHLIQKTVDVVACMSLHSWLHLQALAIVGRGALRALAFMMICTIAGIDRLIEAALCALWLQWSRAEAVSRVFGARHEHESFDGVLLH